MYKVITSGKLIMCLLLSSFNIKINFNFMCKNNNFSKGYYLLKVKHLKNYEERKRKLNLIYKVSRSVTSYMD